MNNTHKGAVLYVVPLLCHFFEVQVQGTDLHLFFR
jgi:hypothetical protein